MHTTGSVDYDILLEGEITLELDDEKTIALKGVTSSCKMVLDTLGAIRVRSQRR